MANKDEYNKLTYCRDSGLTVSGRYAVEGHTRSLILIPIETSYMRLILMNNISHRLPDIVQTVAFDTRVPLVNTFVLGNLCEYRHRHKAYTAKNFFKVVCTRVTKTRFFGLHF